MIRTYTIGIDAGGTFTDLVAIGSDGSVRIAKHPSTPKNPVEAFVGVLKKSEIPLDRITRIVHGTTIGTNAVIQRRGASVVFITTKGFEDVPFIERINRKKSYDLQWLKPQPLVKRRNSVGVAERITAKGEVLQPLTESALADVRDAVERRRREMPVDAIAVCLLFSYVNPVHELTLREYLRQAFPGLRVSLSHQVAPIWREYERSATTLADAFIKPLIANYIGTLSTTLKQMGVQAPCSILKSNGGMTFLENAGDRPVDILLSGLAGGTMGGRFCATSAGVSDAITLDMGGTSADVGLITGGQQRFTTEFEIEWGLPVAVPVIEVRTLGAGGGSIAWIDKGGMLNVGPQSAGAVPGPACYGAGGTDATVTDANLVLGRLNHDYFLGGEMELDPELARAAVARVAKRMTVPLHQAAAAIANIADENMTNAIRLMTIERGLDPRVFALIAFGGAGPLHGVAIARKLGIPQVVVPPHPGLCSALGAAISDLRVEKLRTFAARDTDVTDGQIMERFREMAAQARAELEAEGLVGEPQVTFAISLRYYQQNYEQDVEYVPEKGLAQCFAAFHQLHHQFYGYHFPDETIELVHLKVSAQEMAQKVPVTLSVHGAGQVPTSTRQVWEMGSHQIPYTIYRREGLPTGISLAGPAIVEEVDSTSFIPSDARFRVDSNGNLIIELETKR